MRLNKSKQRDIILEEVRSVRSHPTADEIYDMVRKRLPNVSLGTVYRNLELLSDVGEILKLDKLGGQKRFDGNIERHYHCQCKTCGRVSDIFPKKQDDLNDAIEKFMNNNNIHNYNIEFSYKCDKCRANCKSLII